MGCIVNGPGEMADADFGYVGGAPGKIDLYVGKEVVRRAIPMAGATDELIELIKVLSNTQDAHCTWLPPCTPCRCTSSIAHCTTYGYHHCHCTSIIMLS